MRCPTDTDGMGCSILAADDDNITQLHCAACNRTWVWGEYGWYCNADESEATHCEDCHRPLTTGIVCADCLLTRNGTDTIIAHGQVLRTEQERTRARSQARTRARVTNYHCALCFSDYSLPGSCCGTRLNPDGVGTRTMHRRTAIIEQQREESLLIWEGVLDALTGVKLATQAMELEVATVRAVAALGADHFASTQQKV